MPISVHFVLILICEYEMLTIDLQEHKWSYSPQAAKTGIIISNITPFHNEHQQSNKTLD